MDGAATAAHSHESASTFPVGSHGLLYPFELPA
jgi:hypothetical protein